MTTPSEPAVLAPAGLPILEAARWVGHACWAELRLHELLTGWLAIEVDDAAAARFWVERSEAAERAAAWHRRLPELREFPRSGFVEASSSDVARLFNGLVALDAVEATDQRRGALAALLRGLRLGYHERASVAVGPADAPTAATLHAALRSTFGSHDDADPDTAWTAAITEAGGLP